MGATAGGPKVRLGIRVKIQASFLIFVLLLSALMLNINLERL